MGGDTDFTPTQLGLLGLNGALRAYDWSTTKRNLAGGGQEYNPLLGSQPGGTAQDTAALAAAAASLFGVAALPDKWRSPVLLALAGVELANLTGNGPWGGPSMAKSGKGGKGGPVPSLGFSLKF